MRFLVRLDLLFHIYLTPLESNMHIYIMRVMTRDIV